MLMSSDALTVVWCHKWCCIRCWDHRMHWRNYLIVRTAASDPKRSDALAKLSDVKNAAPDLERSDALTKLSDCLLSSWERSSCWLKCSLSSCRTGELFDWWNDADIARRHVLLMILLSMLQSRTKHWRFDQCLWKNSKSCQKANVLMMLTAETYRLVRHR